MELKTQALDRVLEALSPALAAELDRVVSETRESLEQDFQKRLQSALQDTEQNLRATAEAELQRAVDDVRETTRREVTQQLEEQFKKTLEETTGRHVAEATAERTRLQEQVTQWRTFAEAQRQLSDASSQPEILARFLKLSEVFADGIAVYVTKSDGLALWKSRGKAAFPEIISQETTDPESYFRSISVRGRTVAAISAVQPFKAEALDFLGSTMERAIELFGLKLRAVAPKGGAASETIVAGSAAAASAVEQTDGGDPKVHAEARKTARQLVSEIKLYHEQELKQGREHADIYQRLQKEIDLGREMYNHRVPPAILASHDYFHEEIVRILGENDASRLGAAYPGPMHS